MCIEYFCGGLIFWQFRLFFSYLNTGRYFICCSCCKYVSTSREFFRLVCLSWSRYLRNYSWGPFLMFVEYLCGGLMFLVILAFRISIQVYLPTKKISCACCNCWCILHLPYVCACAGGNFGIFKLEYTHRYFMSWCGWFFQILQLLGHHTFAVYICLRVNVYFHIYIYIYVCIHLYIYICIYTHIYIHI